MAEFFITKKSAPSSVDKASSGVSQRMSKNAGSNSATKTGKGHFAAAAQRIAKKRSGLLQTGVPRHAPTGTNGEVGRSGIVKNLDAGQKVQASEAQSALNPKQQGATSKKAQKDGHDGRIG